MDSANDVLDMRLRGLERDAVDRLRQEITAIDSMLAEDEDQRSE